MARETWVQSQVESYQRLKKWYLMPPCLTLSIIRYGSRVKWSNPGKGVAPSPTPWCSKLSKREPSGHSRLWSTIKKHNILSQNVKKVDKLFHRTNGGCPRGVMVKAMDCRIVAREFVLQSRHYVHFRANTLGKGMNPLILPAMG